MASVKPKFTSRLQASSYHAPGGGEAYAAAREALVKQVIAQGYDADTMIEHGVSWADDQDPFGHIMNAGFGHFGTTCNFRFFESFEVQLGDKINDLMKASGIGIIVKQLDIELKRPVSYPDSIIVAVRLNEVKNDRYNVLTTMWSLRQQAVVASSTSWICFFDYKNNKIADLVEAGGVYKDLHGALSAKCVKMNDAWAEWKKANPPRQKRAQKL